jgi:putative chitinase
MINYNPLHGNVPDVVFKELQDVATKYQINTPLRMAHFLAQCSHESQQFTRTEENLNYSHDALVRVFPKHFGPGNVEAYVRKPMEIASRVYANRMGNGDEASLEGWFYRGRGYIQLTGKNNYTKFDKEVTGNLVLHPELVATEYPLLSAAWFWSDHRLNQIADQGSDQNVVANITKVVNGGYHGLENRQKQFDKFHRVLA